MEKKANEMVKREEHGAEWIRESQKGNKIISLGEFLQKISSKKN